MISNTQLEIASLVNQQIHETLKDYLKNIDVKTLVFQAMSAAIDEAVAKITLAAAEKILRERDIANEISQLIENTITAEINSQSKLSVKTALNQINVKNIISDTVNQSLKLQIHNFSFPDSSIPVKSIKWDNFKLSGNMVEDGIIKNFNSVGIQDQSTTCQLTLIDGMIIAEGKIVSAAMKTQIADIDEITVNKINIKGKVTISDDLHNQIACISQKTVDDKFSQSINLAKNSIHNDGKLLLDSANLGPSIIYSNLRKLGLLQELRVQGDAQINDTLLITSQGKIGINTEEPAGALTIWDQDADLTVKKLSKNNMFLGSTRNGELTLGNDNKRQLTIRNNEVDINSSLRLMGIKFTVNENIPDHNGEVNEIVIVRSAKPGQPFAYVCKGQNVWASLGINVL